MRNYLLKLYLPQEHYKILPAIILIKTARTKKKKGILIEIEDTGIGIPKENLDTGGSWAYKDLSIYSIFNT